MQRILNGGRNRALEWRVRQQLYKFVFVRSLKFQILVNGAGQNFREDPQFHAGAGGIRVDILLGEPAEVSQLRILGT
jgi:hypothetical protein